MPTYEYRCNGCGRDFEYVQRMSDDDLVKCEVCGEDKLEKLISRTAFQLKGGGWYKDLYSSTKPGDTSKESPGSAETPSTSTDAPAAKADAPAAPASSPSSDSSSSGSSGSTTTTAPAASTPSKPSSAS